MRKKALSGVWGTCIVLYKFYHEAFCEIIISRDINSMGTHWAALIQTTELRQQEKRKLTIQQLILKLIGIKKQSEKLKSFLCLFQSIMDSLIECLMLSASWHGVLRILHRNKMDCTQLHTHNPGAAPFVLPWINFSYYIFSCLLQLFIDFFSPISSQWPLLHSPS